MNQITELPSKDYTFGLGFDYAVWDQNTVITLASVKWSADYKDVVYFDSHAKLNAYIDGMASSNAKIEKMSYAPINAPIRLNIPINRVLKYNYIRASNPVQPIPGNDIRRDYYYFITGVAFLAPNTTLITVQLDVFQTFGYEAKFGNCFIETGHIGIANENNFQNYGRDYLTTADGVDIGGEYQVIARRNEKVMSVSESPGQAGYDVLVCSTVDLDQRGNVSEPVLKSATGGKWQHVPSGANYYLYSSQEFIAKMAALSDTPWVSQGIISITLIPKMARYTTNTTGADKRAPDTDLNPQKRKGFTNWREHADILDYIPERYRHLKKFFTYPYMLIEMTTWNGKPVILKPESWNDPDATYTERAALVPPQQRVTFSPDSYNAPENFIGGVDNGEYLDIQAALDNFPTVAVVNNAALGYLASNQAGIAFSYQSADWQGSKAGNAAMAAYNMANQGIDANTANYANSRSGDKQSTALSNDNANAQALVQGAQSIASGAIGGSTGGAAGAGVGALTGLAGAGFGMISNSLNVGTANAQLVNRNNVATRSSEITNNLAAQARDTNTELAMFAMQGDYQNTVNGINAKLQDAKMTQPSVSGQTGGDTFNFIHNAFELSLRWKMVDQAAIRRIGNIWLRYGYPVLQFGRIPDNFMVMTKFTYWKLTETYITTASIPENYKQALRGIFEKGVTVWKNPNDIGAIDLADNKPLIGISL